jgi:hypothetical protein|nr:MAG TPA: hypothetical protein [Bacteriophage sp.]
METNAPKIEWRYDGNFAFGSYPINDDYRAEYMFYDHDFGYGPCFRCFRTIIKSDEDINKIDFDESLEIGTYLPSGFEAESTCENDLKDLLERSKTATNILQL